MWTSKGNWWHYPYPYPIWCNCPSDVPPKLLLSISLLTLHFLWLEPICRTQFCLRLSHALTLQLIFKSNLICETSHIQMISQSNLVSIVCLNCGRLVFKLNVSCQNIFTQMIIQNLPKIQLYLLIYKKSSPPSGTYIKKSFFSHWWPE